MRRLLYHLGIIDIVWTQDTQYCGGDIRLRTVWRTADGRKFVFGHFGPPHTLDYNHYGVELLPDGHVQAPLTYIESWYHYGSKPQKPAVSRAKLTCFRRIL